MIRSIIIALALMLTIASTGYSANYTLEITQPQPSLNTNNRYYRAYPGILYEVPIGVFGGLYPFTYELTTAPSGMTINADTGIITWSNPTTSGSPHPVAVRVTDDENNTDTVSWTITVTTTGFVFIDVNSATSGTGAIDDPINSLEDVWGPPINSGSYSEVPKTSTFDNNFLYFRGGTYPLQGGYAVLCGSDQGTRVTLDIAYHPHVWMGYPGETVTLDHNLQTDCPYKFIALEGGATDVWFSGLTFRDMAQHAVRLPGAGPRAVFYDNIFFNGGPSEWTNESFIMFTSGGSGSAGYNLVKDNLFDTFASPESAYIKTYSTNKLVIDGNTFVNPGSSTEGIAIKGGDQYMSVRKNVVTGYYSGGSIAGNWADCGNLDISFNYLKDTLLTSGGYDGSLIINYHDTSVWPSYMYRNTIEGTVLLRRGSTGRGPFYLYNNVIVNSMAGTPSGSHVTHAPDVTDPSVLVLGSGATANLVGYPADSIIDEYGDLTEAYSAYLGTHGHQTTEAVCSPAYRHLCDVTDCETTGEGYWYDDTCNASPQGALVNGLCGLNDGATLSSLTSGNANNCSAGTVADFSGTGPWTWNCDGANGGTDDACSASLQSTPPVGGFTLISPGTTLISTGYTNIGE